MKTRRATVLLTLLCCITVASVAPAAHAAGSLGVAKWEAGTCTGNEAQVKECKYSSPHSAFYTQAAGHPPWGLTGFELTTSGEAPTGSPVRRLRVDVPPGLAADPQALAVCSRAQFDANTCPAPTKAGFVGLKAYVELPLGLSKALSLEGDVYNLPQEPGHPLLFGIDVKGIPPLVKDVHLLLEGHVSYAHEDSLAARGVPSGDFHEWFEINNVPSEVEVEALGIPLSKAPLKTIESKLFFDGHAGKEGKEDFLTLPSDCGAPPASYLELETYPPVEKTSLPTTPPVGIEGCDKVPFQPTATVSPETSQYDTPDGTTTDVRVPQFEKSNQINTADINDAHVTLPEGLTLNPAAVNGLQACTQSQLHRGSAAPVECPAASKIGTVNIETDLPPHSLAGNVYLGQEDGTSAITGLPHPFLVFIDAESVYDVSVRLEGQAVPDPTTGRLTVSFLGNPQLPFSDLTLTLNGGPRAPLANPLSCDPASTSFEFSAYTGASFADSTPFAVSGCPPSTPFSLAQSTATSAPNAGAYTNYTFNLARGDGNQYLGKLSTVLPPGLVGAIPSVTLCGEPQAQSGACGAGSQIGTATAQVGAGAEPYAFTGPVYLTGPYAGAPYGLSIPIHAAAGPFDLGNVVTHATIGVDPHSSRVIATTTDLPSIFKGVPLRLRNISVVVDRKNFLFNPTNCGPLSTDTALTSTLGATQGLSSPFAVANCSALPFKPNFSAATSASTNPTHLKADGAALRVNLLQNAHEANIHSVVAELPKSLPSRLTTLQKACPAATYEANPFSLPGRLEGRQRDGHHAGASGAAERSGVPRLARRRGVPRPRPAARRRRRRARDPRKQDRHQRRHHQIDVRLDPRRAGLELRARTARRCQLGADGRRHAVHADAHDAHDDRRAERRRDQTEHADRRRRLQRPRQRQDADQDPQQEDQAQQARAARADLRARPREREEPRPAHEVQEIRAGRQVHDQGGAVAQRRQRPARAQAEVQGARRLPAEVEGRIDLGRVREDRLPAQGQAQALTRGSGD